MHPWLGLTRNILLAALAAWIGLWPAADAVTCASRTIFVVAAGAPAAAACDQRVSADQVPTCGGSSCRSEADPPTCDGAATSGCGQLFCFGGLVFFTPADPPPDFRPELQCSVPCGDFQASTRSVQPPVPPPIADLPIICLKRVPGTQHDSLISEVGSC